MNTSRRLRVVCALAVMALSLPFAASADQPAESTVVIVHEGEPNPCRPGETNTVTIVFTLHTHEHDHNRVRVASAELSTSDGFVGTGHQEDVLIDGLLRLNVKHMMAHPDTGERFSVTIRMWVDVTTGETVKGSMVPSLHCIRS